MQNGDQLQLISKDTNGLMDFEVDISSIVMQNVDIQQYLHHKIQVVGLVKTKTLNGKTIAYIKIERPVQITLE